MPTTTPTADGGRVETFVTANAGDGSQTLHIQKFDPAGAAVGAEFDARQFAPFLPVTVTALSNGGFAVVYGFSFRGWSYSASVFDPSGTVIRTFALPGFGEGLAVAASPQGGFAIVDRDTVVGPMGVDYSGHPLVTLYDNTGAAAAPTAQLTGDMPSLSVIAGGHYQLSWTDGNLTHSVDLDPHAPQALAKPAAPGVQLIDDVGPQQGTVANGQATDDATLTLRVAVGQQGFVEVASTHAGGQDDPKALGGTAVTADEVARGYVDVPVQTTGVGAYQVFAHFKSLDGVVSDAAQMSFIYDPTATGTTTAAGGQSLTGAAGGATPMGGADNDTITGLDRANHLRGAAGDASIVGGARFNDINGNGGDNTIVGHSNVRDRPLGGRGADLIFAHGAGDIVYGNLGNDALTDGTGGDVIRGGQGDDSITADSGADTFHTFSGAGLDKAPGSDAAKGDHIGNFDAMILVGVHASALPAGWIF